MAEKLSLAALTISGISLSSFQSPPPITLPALAEAIKHCEIF